MHSSLSRLNDYAVTHFLFHEHRQPNRFIPFGGGYHPDPDMSLEICLETHLEWFMSKYFLCFVFAATTTLAWSITLQLELDQLEPVQLDLVPLPALDKDH